MIIKPGQTGADSSTSELGLTSSSTNNNNGMVPQQMMVPASGMMMAPMQMTMVPVGGPVHQQQQQMPAGATMMTSAQPGLLSSGVLYQQQPGTLQMNHSGSLSNMSTPNVSVGASSSTQYMAVPTANFSGSGSTGLGPMMPLHAMPMGPGVMASAHQGAPVMTQQPGSMPSSFAPSPNAGSPGGGNAADSGPKQLIVNYIPTQVTEFELRSLFDQHGPVECARVIYDKNTGISKGYGFVYYFSSAHAAIALKEMQGFELYGKPMRVGYAMPQRPLAALSPYGGPPSSSPPLSASPNHQQQQQQGSPLHSQSSASPM